MVATSISLGDTCNTRVKSLTPNCVSFCISISISMHTNHGLVVTEQQEEVNVGQRVCKAKLWDKRTVVAYSCWVH